MDLVAACGVIVKLALRRSKVEKEPVRWIGEDNLDGLPLGVFGLSVSCKGNIENSQVPIYMGDGWFGSQAFGVFSHFVWC